MKTQAEDDQSFLPQTVCIQIPSPCQSSCPAPIARLPLGHSRRNAVEGPARLSLQTHVGWLHSTHASYPCRSWNPESRVTHRTTDSPQIQSVCDHAAKQERHVIFLIMSIDIQNSLQQLTVQYLHLSF